MGRKRKPPLLSLEEQLRAHDRDAPPGPTYHVGYFDDPKEMHLDDISAERMQWARKRVALVEAIRKRDAKKLRDPGHDASGNFSPSPYAARGHKVDVAPKELRSNPDSEQFPKRITTQRMIDRYRAQGHIDAKEWIAADHLHRLWHTAGWDPRMTSPYVGKVDNNTTHSGQLSHRMDAAEAYFEGLKAIPRRAKGVVLHVVIVDGSASDWARLRGYGQRQSQRLGLKRLRQGLSALVVHFGY